MKIFLIALMILATSPAFASSVTLQKACYGASNPEVISVDNMEDGAKKIASVGTAAALFLETTKDSFSDSPQKSAKIKINTDKGWRVNVWAGIFDEEAQKIVPTYQVECDGGSMTVKAIDASTLVLDSKYIAGEMTEGPEGCSNARLKFKNLIMKKRACK